MGEMSGINVEKLNMKNTVYLENLQVLIEILLNSITLVMIDSKSPKGNVNEFSKRLQEYLSSEDSRNELLSEMRLIPHLQ